MDWAVWRFWEETQMADWISSRDVGLEDTRLESVKELSHATGKRVALHAWRISGGAEEDGSLEVGLWAGEWWRVAEERERKRTRERMDRKNTEAMEITTNLDGFEKCKKEHLGLVGFL
jgi:hypothetical protein